ncbi:hypothetical protein [Ewingella americana]|uniref:hypothetical protein n=1 Tax=Ewingella americana TaxID=41202 RepID=UPI0012ADDFD2|nr:hypothetical protein [Ewingella americana]MRT05957.1 hypothetical protein [Ewingella americana]
MSWFGTSNREGNIQRMLEMKSGGAGHIKISNAFKKEGIKVEPHQVKAIIECAPLLSEKALPKKVSKEVIKEMKENKHQKTDSLPNGSKA